MARSDDVSIENKGMNNEVCISPNLDSHLQLALRAY